MLGTICLSNAASLDGCPMLYVFVFASTFCFSCAAPSQVQRQVIQTDSITDELARVPIETDLGIFYSCWFIPICINMYYTFFLGTHLFLSKWRTYTNRDVILIKIPIPPRLAFKLIFDSVVV